MAINSLFHITSLKNISKILEGGLLVNSNNHGFIGQQRNIYYPKYGIQPIFMSTKPKDIYDTQLTDHYVKDNKCVVLSVDVNGLKVEDEYEYLKTNPSPWDSFENVDPRILFKRDFICRNDIKPERISIYSCAMDLFFFGQISTDFYKNYINGICV